jgi:hypothetical protein
MRRISASRNDERAGRTGWEGDLMRRKTVRGGLSVLVVATLSLGAGDAMAVPPFELTAEVSSFECTDGGLTVSATASVPDGSGAYLRSVYVSAGQFREIQDSWSPFPTTRVVEWWSIDEWWGRKDGVTSSSLSVETGPSGTWDHHSWSGDLDGVAGTAMDVWQIWVAASASYRGTYLSDYDQVFVDCGDGTVLEPGPATAYCFETATEPPECSA